jgi:putative tricarboxylic transport membrane protein
MKLQARLIRGAAIAAVVVMGAGGCAANSGGGSGSDSSEDYPSKAIEFVTAGDPGGGLDLFARQIQMTLTEEGLMKSQMDITNLGGGGGNPAMAVGRARAGTADTLIGNSNRVYLNPILGTTDLTLYEDFVPIAQMMTEYVALVVHKDSPYNTGTEVLEALAEDPRSLTLGVGTVPSDDQMHLLRVAEEGGVDASKLNIVAFSAGGDLMTQLLGGQVDAISTGLSEALGQYAAGEVKILAISAPERLSGDAAEIPTWKEQGLDVVVEHWRGVFGPADMPADAVAYWEETFAKVVETDTWAKVLETNQWSALYRDSAEFGKVLEEETETAERLLKSVGLL